MKKSLEEAKVQAYRQSMLHPGTTVRVMDKPRKHATVCTSEWVYKERVLDGWCTVVTYRDGKEV